MAFYYGWTLDYIRNLKQSDYILASKSLDLIIAQQKMSDIETISFPNLSRKADRSSIIKRLKAIINREKPVEKTKGLANYNDLISDLKSQLKRAKGHG